MGRTIIINESQIEAIKESNEEVTFFEFFNNVKDFLRGLLEDPINTKPNEFWKKHGFNKSGLIKKLMDANILDRSEKIKEYPVTEATKMESKYIVKYKVRKKNFERKLHRLFSSLFETNSVFKDEKILKDDIMNSKFGDMYRQRGGIKEEGEGGGDAGGSPFAGATNANISASAMFDVPVGGVQRRNFYSDSLKRNKDSKNNSISINRKEK